MNVRFTLIFSLVFFGLMSSSNINAQCDSGSSGLAVIQLESPTLSDIEPLIPGQEYTFEFFYNYLFTAKGTDCIEESEVSFVFSPPGSVNVVSGPTINGSFITLVIVPLNDNFTMRITADDCSASTALSCASLPIRELTVPVDFAHLGAQTGKGNSSVDLSWSTLSEVNNDVFEIQRTDGVSAFETIGMVNGNGNSSQLVEYTFADNNPQIGVNYYRLKQIDLDGGFAFSDVVNAEIVLDEPIVITPNPSIRGGEIKVAFNAKANDNMNMTVFNIAGKTVISETYKTVEGTNSVVFQNDLPKGIYIASMEIGSERITKKIVIQ